ncbi:hypothetical protein N8203_03630 [Crocinitomicaceae bacterium]|nr:hypothetical protein [Crocinitomicaceae bacterium]
MNKGNIIFLSITVIIVFSILFVLLKLPLGNDQDYFKNINCKHNSNEEAESEKKSIFKYLDSDSTINRVLFLNEVFLCHPVGYQQDFDSLSRFFGDERMAEDSLTEILTNNLFEKNQKDFSGFNPNQLMKYIVFAERMSTQNTARKYKYFFQGVHYYWFNKVSNKLNALVHENSDYRFNPMYRVLVSRCAQNNYHISLEFTALEKVTSYFIEGKYSYVWGRIWLRTSVFQKTIMIIGVLFSFISYILTLNYILRFIKVKIKKS